MKLKEASNCCERAPGSAKSAYANGAKTSITSQKLGSFDFWRIANGTLNKSKSSLPALFNDPEVLSSASDKAKLLAESFSKNSNLDYSSISLLAVSSRTNLKLHIPATLKLLKRVMADRDLSKAYSPNCVPVIHLNNCKLKLSDILVELLNIFLKENCLPDSCRVSSVVPVFKKLERDLRLKTFALLASFMWQLKSLKNLQIIGLLIAGFFYKKSFYKKMSLKNQKNLRKR